MEYTIYNKSDNIINRYHFLRALHHSYLGLSVSAGSEALELDDDDDDDDEDGTFHVGSVAYGGLSSSSMHRHYLAAASKAAQVAFVPSEPNGRASVESLQHHQQGEVESLLAAFEDEEEDEEEDERF